MKLLFDENLSFKLCRMLATAFPGSTQVRLVGLDTADDASVWGYAAEHGFALVTQDADFAEMAALRGLPPKVLWLRFGNSSTAAIASILLDHAELIEVFGEDNSISCLEIY